jgi:multidrug efflux system membrane fusion protein
MIMTSATHRLLLGGLIVASACAVSACSGDAATTDPPRARGGASQPAVPVTVAKVVQKPMPIQISVIGTAEAYTNVAVHAQLTGQLETVSFREGDDVRKGQVLFTLDRRPLEAALQQAQATLDRDLAQAANAKAQLTRYRDLLARGITTHEQVDQVVANAAALDATVGADRAVIDNAKVQLQYATIAAPIGGRTGALMVHAGNLVRANDTAPLVVINQVTPIYVTFGVPEGQLPALKRYMAAGPLHVDAQPPNDTAAPSNGRITFVDNAVDQTTGTIKIKATFPNEDRRLWPGQFVNVTVALTTEPNALVVPAAAVQTGQQGQYVFVVNADQSVELRTVTIARSNGVETVLATGVRAGDTVVTDGQLRLVPGTKITVKAPEGGKAAS